MCIRVFIVVCEGMRKVSFYPNRAFWQLNLATRTNRESESRANCLAKLSILSYSAPVVVTLQLPCMLHKCATLVTCQSQDPITKLLWLHTSWDFFTFFHTQPLYKSHLNIRYLIAKLQVNLARNKTNTWLNKLNLTVWLLDLMILLWYLFESMHLMQWG